MKKYILLIIGVAASCLFAGCASSSLVTSAPDPSESASGARSFSLASDFPADLAIPDIEGMRGTAFVVSASDPAAVIAVDIDADPMVLSDRFAGLLVPAGSGVPARLLVTAADQAFLLTSLTIISFDPTSGRIKDQEVVIAPLSIDAGLANSDGSPAASPLTPSYPGGLAIALGRLFVSSANYVRTDAPAVAAPGTVQAFDVSAEGELARAGFFVTSASNPTGLSVRNERELVVVNSGVIDIVDAHGVPQTDAAIDIVDPETLAIRRTIALGKTAPSPSGLALTKDGSRGFAGSAAYGEVYEIDLVNRQVLRGADDPIVATGGVDYMSSVALSMDDGVLFAASFETSAVVPFDLSAAVPTAGAPFAVGFPSGVTDENPSGANTGAGAVAVRPGSRGVDYEGEDLFVLTGYPGQLVAVNTGSPAQAYAPPAEDEVQADATPVPPPPSGTSGETCQGFAQAVASVNYGPGAGFGQSLMDEVVLGPPRGSGAFAGGLHVVSLGQGGEIVLDLGSCPAVDGPGADFIVFENAFFIGGNPDAPYAELAIVAASEDGVNFTAFACADEDYPYDGCAGWHPVYSHPTNGVDPFDQTVAGGEAFDLGSIGMTRARYVRITDNGASGSAGTTAGFDLDAIAVVNGEIEN